MIRKAKNRKIKIIFLCLILTSVVFNGFAFEKKTLDIAFIKANLLYEQGDYNEAISAYRGILEKGLESGNIYYNLGNCYFKKDNLGKTILNYARAKRLIPRDRDLQANYKYAKSLIKRSVVASSQSWITKFANSFFNQFTIDGLTVFLFLIYILLIIVLGLGCITKMSRLKLSGLVTILGIAFLISIGFLSQRIFYSNKNAVIIEETVEAKFEPFASAAVYFNLYEGMEVEIISTGDGWFKIKRADDKVGWIKKRQLERI